MRANLSKHRLFSRGWGRRGFTPRIPTVLSVEEVTPLLRADRVTGGNPGDEVPLHRVREIESGTDRCRRFAGRGMDLKIQFRDDSPPPSAWAPSFESEWWLLEPSQQLYWFVEADDCSEDTVTPSVNRP